MSRKKDREKFAIHSVGIKVENLKVGMLINYIHPKFLSFQCQRIYKIKGNKIVMRNAVGNYINISINNVRKIIEE